jgi:hypothetical protein
MMIIAVNGEKRPDCLFLTSQRIGSSCPGRRKTAGESKVALKDVVWSGTVKCFYSDCSRELKRAATDLGWVHAASAPYCPQSNSIIERRLRLIIEGARTVMIMAGFVAELNLHCWWPVAARYFSFVACFSGPPDNKSDFEQSLYFERYQKLFAGTLRLFGSL